MAYLNFPIGVAFPTIVRRNEDISELFPDWNAESIYKKIGIESRFICDSKEDSVGLAVEAFRNLSTNYENLEFDFVVYVSNSTVYQAPGDGHVFLRELKLAGDIGCVDINLGCSGFTYGLGLASALVDSGNCNNVLLVTTDAYSKFISSADKSNMTLFGDGAAASLITKNLLANDGWKIDNFKFGSNGEGLKDLNIKSDASGIVKNLYMDGKNIFDFAANEVVEFIRKQNIDFENCICVFHQANSFMLEYMRRKLGIKEEFFLIAMKNRGNTVSASIPYAISDNSGDLLNMNLFLCGFGIGASYSSVCLSRINTI